MKIQMFVLGLVILLFGSLSTMPAADSGRREPSADGLLELALQTPQAFMFAEHVTSTTGDSSKDLIVTSARSLQLNPETVIICPGTMRIFRADADRDDFTRQGGWHWHCGDTHGDSQFKQPGALIMVVRQQDGTVHWYSLVLDLRC
jgi:hypothetical protein